MHDHPITAETEALADQVHGPHPAGINRQQRPQHLLITVALALLGGTMTAAVVHVAASVT